MVGKPEGARPLGSPRRRWIIIIIFLRGLGRLTRSGIDALPSFQMGNNIKIEIKVVGWGYGLDWSGSGLWTVVRLLWIR
jgi:hypothetical protein